MAADAQYNVLYPSGSQNLLKGNFHLCTGDEGHAVSGTAVALVDSGYEFKVYHETFYADVGSGVVATNGIETISSPTCVSGVLDGGNAVFSSVPIGTAIRHVIVFQSGSNNGSIVPNVGGDYLLADFTTGSGGAEINITPNGGDITVSWNASGILAISGGCP